MRFFIFAAALLLDISSTFFPKSIFAEKNLALTRQFREAPAGESRPVLVRELLRQAVLIAAREELGLSTSDEVLAAAIEPEAERLVLRPNLKVKADASMGEFGVYAPDSDEALWMQETKTTDIDLGVLSRDLQRLSRNEFPVLLSKLGLKANTSPIGPNTNPRSNVAKMDAKDLVAIRDLHRDFEIFPQCLAIQRLHGAIQKHGNDPELLGMLAKTYANLFQLTEPLMDGLPQALAARALLYGDRVVDLFPEDVEARWSRGYAHAFVGSLKTAEKDLLLKIEEQPVWAKIARNIVLFEGAELEELSEKSEEPYNKLAAFGRVMVSDGNPISQIRLASLQRAEALMPGNQRLLLGIFSETGPGVASSALGRAISSWQKRVADFKLSPGLPNEVTNAKSYRNFILQLAKSSSQFSSEFPNSTIARIIDDMNLWLNAAVIGENTMAIGLDTSEMVDECRTDLAGHRHWQFIELMRDLRQSTDNRLAAAFLDRLSKVRVLDVTPNGIAVDMAHSPWYDKKPAALMPHALTVEGTIERSSSSAWEFLRFARNNPTRLSDDAWSKSYTESMIELAPHSPCANAFWLSSHWATEKGRINEIRSRFADSTSLDWVIARNSRQAKDNKTAIEAFERIVVVSSDAELFKDLAETYRDVGNLDKWAETLERCLDFDSPDLKGAVMMVQLAQHFLKAKDDPLTALRFAKGAAQTGARWGLNCLAEVHVALEEWDQAEELIRSMGERYSKPYEWFVWCLNHQQGDLEAARKVAMTFERKLKGERSQASIQTRFLLRKMLELEIDNELKEKVLEFATSSAYLHYILFEYWEEKNLADRDKIVSMLETALNQNKKQSPPTYNSSSERITVDLLKTQASTDQATRVLDAAIQANPKDLANLGYFGGRFLELSGDTAQAIKYYEMSSKSGEISAGGYAILYSKMRLRALKQ